MISDVENSFNAVGKRGKKEKVKFAPRCSEMHNLNTYMGHASEFVTQNPLILVLILELIVLYFRSSSTFYVALR